MHPKTHIYPHFYTPYEALINMYPRKIIKGEKNAGTQEEKTSKTPGLFVVDSLEGRARPCNQPPKNNEFK